MLHYTFKTSVDDVESILKKGLGDDADTRAIELLAYATCFDKKGVGANTAKVAKQAIKKHATKPIQDALKIVSRKNFYPTNNPTPAVFEKEVKKLDCFEKLLEIDDFDYVLYARALGALHHSVLIYLLRQKNMIFFEAFIEQAFDAEFFNASDLAHEYRRIYDHSICSREMEIISSMNKFVRAKITSRETDFELPSNFSSWTRLESLDIDAYNTQDLTREQLDMFGNLSNLKHLKLRMAVTDLPDVSGLKHLEALDLSHNYKLAQLPDSMQSLSRLESLSLQQCSGLKGIADCIGGLVSLESLDLTNVYGEFYSSRMGELGSLKRLRASHFKNDAELFAAIGQIKNLRELVVGESSTVTKLPDSLGELTKLEKLHLYNMPHVVEWFSGFNQLIHLNELRISKVGGNINGFSSEVDLESLRDSHRHLNGGSPVLLEDFSNFKSLTKLAIQNVNFAGVFPESILSCDELSDLRLVGREIPELPEDIGALKKLTNLSISSANLTRFPSSLFDINSLEELKISSKNLPDFPTDLGKLTSLKVLDCSGCLMTTFPDSFTNLTSLQRLSIGSNFLGSLPEGFEKLDRLNLVEGEYAGVKSLHQQAASLAEQMPWCSFELSGISQAP